MHTLTIDDHPGYIIHHHGDYNGTIHITHYSDEAVAAREANRWAVIEPEWQLRDIDVHTLGTLALNDEATVVLHGNDPNSPAVLTAREVPIGVIRAFLGEKTRAYKISDLEQADPLDIFREYHLKPWLESR